MVDEKKPLQGEKGQYGYVRQAEEKPKRSRKKRTKNVEPPPADVDQYAAVEGLVGLPAIPMPGLAGLMPIENERVEIPELPDSHNVTTMFPKLASSSAPLDHTTVRKSPAEEEMDEEESEWVVRVGDAQPPAWGKRKASEEAEEWNRSKRARRIDSGTPSQQADQSVESAELTPQVAVAIANMHVIDQSIHDIAKEFRFTVQEVQEYYDKCGEMGRTRNRFQKMRHELQSKFIDDDR